MDATSEEEFPRTGNAEISTFQALLAGNICPTGSAAQKPLFTTPSAVAIAEEFLIALAPASYRPKTVICSERIQTIESVTTPVRIDRRGRESRFIILIVRGIGVPGAFCGRVVLAQK
jgi:hypothetical protein